MNWATLRHQCIIILTHCLVLLLFHKKNLWYYFIGIWKMIVMRILLRYITFFQVKNWRCWNFFSFWPRSLSKPPEAKLWASVTSLRSQILAEDVSFHMRYCLLSWDKNWSIQRPLSLSGSFWTIFCFFV